MKSNYTTIYNIEVCINEVLKLFAVPAYIFYKLFHYFSEFITFISDFFLRVFFKTNADEMQTVFSKEELGNYINVKLETRNNDDEVDSEILESRI